MSPVGDEAFLPDGSPLHCPEVMSVRDSTSGRVHHVQGRRVQLPSHFEPQELLHFPNFILHEVPIDFHFCRWDSVHHETIKVFQVPLEKNTFS